MTLDYTYHRTLMIAASYYQKRDTELSATHQTYPSEIAVTAWKRQEGFAIDGPLIGENNILQKKLLVFGAA